MKGDDAYARKYQNLDERSSKLSAYEIVQTIIGINLLIVSVVSACIEELKKDNKKKTIFSFGWLDGYLKLFYEPPSFKLVVYFSKSKTEEKYYE